MQSTYRDLIEPIPARRNLGSVASGHPLKTCVRCRAVAPDRAAVQNKTIHTPYESVDVYPDFSELKASAKAGCGLCWLIRKALRQNWAVRPMEEWGIGPLSADDDDFAELLGLRWDRRVKIYNLSFKFEPLADLAEEKESDALQRGGMVTGMSLEFGPASGATSASDEQAYGEISQIIGFKVFDSIG